MIILEKERSENARSYAVRVLYITSFTWSYSLEPQSVKMSFPARCLYQEHLSVKR